MSELLGDGVKKGGHSESFSVIYQKANDILQCWSSSGSHARIQEISSGGGGPGRSDKKSSDNVFLVLSLFYRSQTVNFQRNLFYKVPEGVQHFPGAGGVQLLTGGGVQLLIPYRNPYNL